MRGGFCKTIMYLVFFLVLCFCVSANCTFVEPDRVVFEEGEFVKEVIVMNNCDNPTDVLVVQKSKPYLPDVFSQVRMEEGIISIPGNGMDKIFLTKVNDKIFKDFYGDLEIQMIDYNEKHTVSVKAVQNSENSNTFSVNSIIGFLVDNFNTTKCIVFYPLFNISIFNNIFILGGIIVTLIVVLTTCLFFLFDMNNTVRWLFIIMTNFIIIMLLNKIFQTLWEVCV